ncbi:MAG: copper chaperone PCu(A)C [Pseudomonadota bacterium]
MTFKALFAAATAATVVMSAPLMAADFMVKDAYVRSATPSAKSGAAFMMLMNNSGEDDVLIAASSDVAPRVELHKHEMDENGVMKMTEIEGGIAIPAGGMHHMTRGGDHVMFMGLTEPLAQGSEITVTLTFEKAGDVEISVPVDHERKPAKGEGHDHSGHSHSHNHDS